MRRYIILGILLIGAGSLAHLAPKTYEVRRTSDGFEPPELSIRPGDTVRFFGSGNDFWPASDAHPSHGFYRQFDPRTAIAGDDSWAFVFERPGPWTYHDHLTPRARGVIRVSGPIPPLSECLSFYGTSTAQAFCWGRTLIDTIAHDGLEGAFRDVETMRKDTAFESQCHDVMHLIGAAAYAEFLSDETHVYTHPMTSSCGFGYYHGLVETMLVDRGPGDLGLAREYCDALGQAQSLPTETARWRARDACYHGIGHALFDTIDASSWGDTDRMVRIVESQCERLSDDTRIRELCMSGVYNSLANAYSSHSYGLIPPPLADSYCATQRDGYRERCYVELTAGMMRRERILYEEALTHIRSLPAGVQTHALRAYLDDEFRHYMTDPTPERVSARCADLTEKREHMDCIAGALRAFSYRAAATPETLAPTLYGFCALESESSFRVACVAKARAHLSTDIPSSAAEALCVSYFDEEACRTPSGDL